MLVRLAQRKRSVWQFRFGRPEAATREFLTSSVAIRGHC